MSLRVLVLAGGLSYERDVSLHSGRRIVDALRRAEVDVSLADADGDLLPRLDRDKPDAVFIGLHGASGEDGALRGVLELVGIPYVGPDPRACRLAWDKPSAKSVWADAGLPTPTWIALPHETFRELGAGVVLDRLVDSLGLPLMVKPVQGGSSLGARAVHAADGMPAAMVGCFAYADTALIEPYVEGAELAVSIIDLGDGPVALPAVEIVPPDGRYDYAARYTAGTTTWHIPARLPQEVLDEAARIAVAAHTVLGLRDLSRVDLIVEPSGRIQLLEVNVSPGMTETSLLPMAVQADGRELGTVLRTLCERAAERSGTLARGTNSAAPAD